MKGSERAPDPAAPDGYGPARPPTDSPLAALRQGALDLAPAAPVVLAFGLGFGAAAVERGLAPGEALAMSALVFAGAAQFAALDLWTSPLPWLALLTTTLAINARHLVLGLTLRERLGGVSALRRSLAATVLSDANWAATRRSARTSTPAAAHLTGGGLILWTSWCLGTALGAVAGGAVGNLQRFGIDALLPTFFLTMLLHVRPQYRDAPPWLVAAAATLGLALLIPIHWAVLAAAGLGGGLAIARDRF